MKLLKIILSAVLVLVVSVSVIACKKGGGEDDTQKISQTDSYLVKDGKTEYVIVYPEKTNTPLIEISLSELTLFFERATGIALTAKSDDDDGVAWSKSAKYISLGETTLLTSSGAGKNIDRKKLKATGYAIRNVGNSVFLIGGEENGVLNAVYRFLREQFNFVCYAADEIVIDSDIKNTMLLDYKVHEIPAIAFHGAAQNEPMLNQIYARRIGMVQQADWIVEMGGAFYHNWLGTIPPSVYHEKKYEKWFSSGKNQLCLTRDKDGLAKEVLKKVIEVVQSNPSGYAIGFTQQDDAGWCECPSCVDCATKYGGNAASQILFMNYLWDLLEPWLESNAPDRTVYLYMFAYQNNTDPPSTDENGNLPPEMILNENIYVQFAPIYAAGYQSYDYKNPGGSDNSSYDKMIKGWQKVTDKIMFWSYSFYYKTTNAMYPYFDFSDLKETFTYLANNGVEYLFDEDHSGNAKIWSDWSRLKYFLRGRLAWDLEADLGALTDEFFDNYFKVASKTMRRLFDEYSTHYAMIIQENGLRGQGGQIDIVDTNLWPRRMLDGWMRLLEQAYDDIEFLKTSDFEMWSKLEERIRLESISLRYLCETLYSDCIYTGNGNTILDDCHYFGITYIG